MTDPETLDDEERFVETLTFTTRSKKDATRLAEDDERVGERYEFRLPDDATDTVYVAFRPKRATFAALVSAASRRASGADGLWEMFHFLDNVLDEKSSRILSERLDDIDDSLEAEDVVDVMNHLVKQWSDKADTTPTLARRRAR